MTVTVVRFTRTVHYEKSHAHANVSLFEGDIGSQDSRQKLLQLTIKLVWGSYGRHFFLVNRKIYFLVVFFYKLVTYRSRGGHNFHVQFTSHLILQEERGNEFTQTFRNMSTFTI